MKIKAKEDFLQWVSIEAGDGNKGAFSAGVGSENRAKLFVAENFPLNGFPLSRSICPVLESEIKHLRSISFNSIRICDQEPTSFPGSSRLSIWRQHMTKDH